MFLILNGRTRKYSGSCVSTEDSFQLFLFQCQVLISHACATEDSRRSSTDLSPSLVCIQTSCLDISQLPALFLSSSFPFLCRSLATLSRKYAGSVVGLTSIISYLLGIAFLYYLMYSLMKTSVLYIFHPVCFSSFRWRGKYGHCYSIWTVDVTGFDVLAVLLWNFRMIWFDMVFILSLCWVPGEAFPSGNYIFQIWEFSSVIYLIISFYFLCSLWVRSGTSWSDLLLYFLIFVFLIIWENFLDYLPIFHLLIIFCLFW